MALQPPGTRGYPKVPAVARYSASLLSQVCSFGGVSALREGGQRPETMHEAYFALVKLVSLHEGVEQLEHTYTWVREVHQDKHHPQEARRWRAKALHHLMHQVQETKVYVVLKARSGHLLRDRQATARELVSYWGAIIQGGTRSVEECRECLAARRWPVQWSCRWQGCTEELV